MTEARRQLGAMLIEPGDGRFAAPPLPQGGDGGVITKGFTTAKQTPQLTEVAMEPGSQDAGPGCVPFLEAVGQVGVGKLQDSLVELRLKRGRAFSDGFLMLRCI